MSNISKYSPLVNLLHSPNSALTLRLQASWQLKTVTQNVTTPIHYDPKTFRPHSICTQSGRIVRPPNIVTQWPQEEGCCVPIHHNDTLCNFVQPTLWDTISPISPQSLCTSPRSLSCVFIYYCFTLLKSFCMQRELPFWTFLAVHC